MSSSQARKNRFQLCYLQAMPPQPSLPNGIESSIPQGANHETAFSEDFPETWLPAWTGRIKHAKHAFRVLKGPFNELGMATFFQLATSLWTLPSTSNLWCCRTFRNLSSIAVWPSHVQPLSVSIFNNIWKGVRKDARPKDCHKIGTVAGGVYSGIMKHWEIKKQILPNSHQLTLEWQDRTNFSVQADLRMHTLSPWKIST